MKVFFDILAWLVAALFIFGMFEAVIAWSIAVYTDAPLIEQIDAKTSLIANTCLLILAINVGWLRKDDDT